MMTVAMTRSTPTACAPPKYGNDDPYADSILYAYEDWFCHANGDIVIQVDSDVCPSFTRGRKCKFCNHLCDVDERGMGTCKGFSIHNWGFAEMGAQNCEQFEPAA